MAQILIDEIKIKIARIVHQLDLPIKSDDAILRNDIDSLEFVELIMQVEMEFKIEIPHGLAVDLKTLNDFSNFVFNTLNPK